MDILVVVVRRSSLLLKAPIHDEELFNPITMPTTSNKVLYCISEFNDASTICDPTVGSTQYASNAGGVR